MEFMKEFFQYCLLIAPGLLVTIPLLFISLILGVIIGALFVFIRFKKYTFLSKFVEFAVSVIRGTPLILQLSIVYFSLPGVFGFKLNLMTTGIITFGINSAAYMSEIFRSGIESIPKEQFEAAKTLHIPTFYIWKDIIIPQIIRNIFPAFINECISLLKETALISTIGGADIMRHSQYIASEKFIYFMPLCIAGIYYYMIVLIIERVGKFFIEKKINKDKTENFDNR